MNKRTMAVLVALCCLPFASARGGTKVVFSFGKVEVLRAGATEWEFVRSGVELRADDLVRMPPQGLLRLKGDGSRELPILAGVHESTLEELVAEARETSPNRNGRRVSPTSPEPAAVDVLPAGDPAARRSPAKPLRFTDAEFVAWKRDARGRNPLVQELARRVTSQYARTEASSRYPTARIQAARGLYDAMRNAVESGSPVLALFPEGDARPAYLFAALLSAADVPFEQALDESRRPVVLVELAESTTAARRVSANAGLVRRGPNDRIMVPLAVVPSATTFLDAWYAAENAVRSRVVVE
jgi:hypothetical protein